ncbi:MAG: triose-phosphate isomerase [Myxococcota bacterium]|nr:triose-phosphate isomerase [Myxococcota bacterium]
MSQNTRRMVIAGNWKMNTTLTDAQELAEAIATGTPAQEGLDVILIPPAPFLGAVSQAVSDGPVAVGAQNMHPEPGGAFTGEISGAMLLSVGVDYVVCGHSERRQIFGESGDWVGTKVAAAHRQGLTPILCVGETLEDREDGRTSDVVLSQLRDGMADLGEAEALATIIAYEPVWAIGTGRTATPEQAQEVHLAIREWLTQTYGASVAQLISIQYGGSVKPANAEELLGQPDIDGALVGGASLQAESFLDIIRAGARAI